MRVVIVGGGFGGVRTAIKLAGKKGFDVKLISDKPYFEYHAAMYRAATGRSPMEVAIPLKKFFTSKTNVEVVEDKIVKINPKIQQIVGKGGSRYEYDSLVISTGSITQYFGIKGLERYSFGIKSINEALRLKRHLHREFAEKAGGRTNYVIVGGGPTGVELAAELVSYLKHIYRRHKLAGRSYKVILVEAADRLMPSLPQSFTDKLSQRLKRLGIDMHFNTAVEGETKDELDLPGDADIKTHTVVWTAGTTNNPLLTKHPDIFKFGRGQKVEVDQHLRASENIFVIGDAANTKFSGMAQTALYDGEFVAKNLIKKNRQQQLISYRPKQPIYAIPAGKRWTAVLWGKIPVYGYLGWVLRRLADLKLYLKFMPPTKALATWRYGFKLDETCPECK